MAYIKVVMLGLSTMEYVAGTDENSVGEGDDAIQLFRESYTLAGHSCVATVTW
jgi:hypothetical protein